MQGHYHTSIYNRTKILSFQWNQCNQWIHSWRQSTFVEFDFNSDGLSKLQTNCFSYRFFKRFLNRQSDDHHFKQQLVALQLLWSHHEEKLYPESTKYCTALRLQRPTKEFLDELEEAVADCSL